MEIIHIILGKANPNRLNGVNKVVYQLATKQAEFGLNVSVWGITKDITVNFEERNFNTVLFTKPSNPFEFSKQLQANIIEKKGKAVFHIHGGWIPAFFSIAKYLNEHHIDFVFTPHGAYNEVAMQRNSFIKRIYFKLFESKIISYATKIHCIGASEVLGLNAIYKTNKTVLLPYGFEFEDQVISKPIDSANESIIFGYVGRLDIYTKGLDLLIKAFAQFNKKNQNSKLWIIGDSSEKFKLKKMISEFDLNNSVILWGSKFGEEKNELVKQMDFFCHPSRNEGLPSAVLEALNFGIPCIVSKATNVANQIISYNSGLVVENDNDVSLSESLFIANSLLTENKLNSLKANAQLMVRECFNWNILLPKFNDIYSL